MTVILTYPLGTDRLPCANANEAGSRARAAQRTFVAAHPDYAIRTSRPGGSSVVELRSGSAWLVIETRFQ